jgi:hypothetical protein
MIGGIFQGCSREAAFSPNTGTKDNYNYQFHCVHNKAIFEQPNDDIK